MILVCICDSWTAIIEKSLINMTLAIGSISLVFTFFMSIFQIHKVLRNSQIYKVIFTIALLLPLITLLEFLVSKTNLDIFHFLSLGPICFLILYKKFDMRILSKYNRNIYFYTEYSKSKESNESTWEEFLYQIILFFIPLFLGYLGYWIINIF